VLSGRGLCDQLITRPEGSYRLRRYVRSRNLNNQDAITRTRPQHHREGEKKVRDLVGGFGLGWESIIIFPIYNNRKYSGVIQFFAIRPVFRNELESEN